MGPKEHENGQRAMTTEFEDTAPTGAELTDYDRAHIKLYMRLLDSAADGASWRDAVLVLFGIDSDREPERARHVYDSHFDRARWMTQTGYTQLLRQSIG